MVVVHHENRAGQISGAWEGAPDLLVHVQAHGNGRTRLYWEKSRWSSSLHQTSAVLTWSDLRASTTKTRQALWVDLPDVLADAIEATLPPREDRDLEAPLFPGATADRLRTAIARSCKASGVPVFSPHDLRHRRISLLHAQGRSWAEIGRLVGQKKLSVTADTYTHVLSDGTELDYASVLARRP